MAASIQLDVDRGEIRIGGSIYRGGPAAGGGLVVADSAVRAITLAERSRLVGLVPLSLGGDRRRQIARLIGDAAVDGAAGAHDVELRAALEAVALQLAGAERSGRLARTTLLVGRALGECAGALPAEEADRLAEALADGIEEGSDDGGWTTIRFGSAAATDDVNPCAVRDRLAALLLARDEQPLDPKLAAALVRSASDAQLERQVEEDAVDTRRTPPDPEPESLLREEAPRVDRWRAARSVHGVSTEVDAGTAPPRGVSGGRSPAAARSDPELPTGPQPVDAALRPARASMPGATSPRTTTASARRVDAEPMPWAGAAPHREPARVSDPGPEDPPPSFVGFGVRRVLGSDPFSGHLPAIEVAGDRSTSPPVIAPAGERVDLDLLADALHRAADLRGLRR